MTNSDLSRFFEHSISEPLSLENTLFSPAKHWKDLVDCAYSIRPWRNTSVRGVVHDENCYFFGEEAGNAGLFSTTLDLHRFCCMLNEGLDGANDSLSIFYSRCSAIKTNPTEYPWIGLDFKDVVSGYWVVDFCFLLERLGTLVLEPQSGLIPQSMDSSCTDEPGSSSRDGNLAAMHQFRPRLHNLLLSMV